MNTNSYKNNWQYVALLSLGLLFIANSCGSITDAVENALKEDEKALSTVDDLAVHLLADSVVSGGAVEATTAAYLDTTGSNYIIINGSTRDTLAQSDKAGILTVLDNNSKTIAIKSDKAYEITTSANYPRSCYSFTPTSNTVVFYLTDYVTLEIYEEDGDLVTLSSEVVPLELSAACYKIVSTTPTPIIKARFEYNLTKDSRYMLIIVKNDQTVDDVFNCAILGE